MDLKVGDLVAFKKYEDMTGKERYGTKKEFFPKFGEVEIIFNVTGNVKIKGSSRIFNRNSIDYVISDSDEDNIHAGDEVLIKATVLEVKGDNILVPWISKEDVVEVLERKEEHFIVQEDNYGMYVYGLGVLISNKDDAKIYNSRNEANEVAADMHLNAWEVIPYDD